MQEENSKLMKEIQANYESSQYYTGLQDYCEELQANLEAYKLKNE